VTFLGDRAFTACGIDPSSDATAIAVERGLEVTQSTLEEWVAIEQNPGRYGAVVMVNVLEHVPDAVAFVGNAVRLISRDGLLVVRVPNDFSELQAAAGALVHRQEWWIEAPDHINYFNRSALASVFESVNLDVIICAGDFPMEFFPLLGVNYIDDTLKGPQAHQMRQRFEFALPTDVRQRLYRALMSVDVGRNLLMVGRKK
jgi:SAM-dependent methyltransferase